MLKAVAEPVRVVAVASSTGTINSVEALEDAKLALPEAAKVDSPEAAVMLVLEVGMVDVPESRERLVMSVPSAGIKLLLL